MTGMGRPPLWRQGDFAKIWSAATVSAMGSEVTIIALPFLALTMLGASVFQASLLAAVEILPFLLFTLPAGAWLDRVRRRPILVAADIARAITLFSIPVAFVAGALTLWQLYVVAFVTGTVTAFFDIADQSYLPAILDRDDLVDANAHLQISCSVAQIGGPIVGGNIIALVAAPVGDRRGRTQLPVLRRAHQRDSAQRGEAGPPCGRFGPAGLDSIGGRRGPEICPRAPVSEADRGLHRDQVSTANCERSLV